MIVVSPSLSLHHTSGLPTLLVNKNQQLLPKSLVATIGVFDGVHLGHTALLQELSSYAEAHDMASAVITFAEPPVSVLKNKFNYTILSTPQEKRSLIASHGIDVLIELRFTAMLAQCTAQEFIDMLHRSLGVDALIVGYDHRFGHDKKEGWDDYCRYGEAIGVDMIQGTRLTDSQGLEYSSSRIRSLIDQAQMEQANALLGYPYSIEGMVVHGKKLGRELGYPTANISPLSEHKQLPPYGVYAAQSIIPASNNPIPGMLYIGRRPTLIGSLPISIEMHLFDTTQDLYGQKIQTQILSKIRGEMKFPNLEALREQIDQDAIATKEYFKLS